MSSPLLKQYPSLLSKARNYYERGECLVYCQAQLLGSRSQRVFLRLFCSHIQIITTDPRQVLLLDLEFQMKFSLSRDTLTFLRDQQRKISFRPASYQLSFFVLTLKTILCEQVCRPPFKLEIKLKSGPNSRVYIATHTTSDAKQAPTALKVFTKRQLSFGKKYELFRKQAKVMLKCRQNSLCKIFGVYQTKSAYILSLPYFSGGNLLQRSQVKKFEFSEKLHIMRQLLQKVSALHEEGIVHRDIKPENIMFEDCSRLNLQIIDYGLASQVDEIEAISLKCGTPGFVAPEIYRSTSSLPYSEKVDIFSAGITFYWLIYSKLPYQGVTEEQIKEENYHFNFKDVIEREQLESKDLIVELLSRMLHRNAEDRISANQALLFPPICQKTLQLSTYRTKFELEEDNLEIMH